jgi:hypothetical protein
MSKVFFVQFMQTTELGIGDQKMSISKTLRIPHEFIKTLNLSRNQKVHRRVHPAFELLPACYCVGNTNSEDDAQHPLQQFPVYTDVPNEEPGNLHDVSHSKH